MRKFVFGLLLALMLCSGLKAQTVLLGASGSDSFSNLNFGVTAGIELPFLQRYEIDVSDTYSPYESHVGLGHGHANIFSAGGRYWLTNNFAVSGKIEQSGYSVTQVSKTAFYLLSGVTLRRDVLGFKSRINFGYIQQVNNGIVNGVETSHLRGGYIGVESRMGCTKHFCFRASEQFSMGHVLNQGNPVCDGTFGSGNFTTGPYPCPRSSGFGGGASFSFLIELKRDLTEDDIL